MPDKVRKYWVRPPFLQIVSDWCVTETTPDTPVAVYLAADVEAVEALRRLTQAECLGLRRALMDIANYPHTGDDLKNLIACEDIARKALQEPFTGEALLDALAAKEARIGELERFKQYVHRCVEEHGSYKP